MDIQKSWRMQITHPTANWLKLELSIDRSDPPTSIKISTETLNYPMHRYIHS